MDRAANLGGKMIRIVGKYLKRELLSNRDGKISEMLSNRRCNEQ
jgi:hypothetical protein